MESICQCAARIAVFVILGCLTGCGGGGRPEPGSSPGTAEKRPDEPKIQSHPRPARPAPTMAPTMAPPAAPAVVPTEASTEVPKKALKAAPKMALRATPRAAPKMAAKMATKKETEDPKILYYAPESVPTADSLAEDGEYTVVKVYYGTDRARMAVADWLREIRAGWPRLTLVLGAASLILFFWAFRGTRRLWRRAVAWTAIASTLVAGGLTLAARFQPEPPERRLERMYGGGRGELELGHCEVSIPKSHQVGQLESPSVLRLEFREDPERHVVLLGVEKESADEFYRAVSDCVARSQRKEAFVFVHGYNVAFADAARRTAQVAHDLKFSGAPIFYSWPSQAKTLDYLVDETNVVWTVPHLKEFLLGIAHKSGATSIHLVAHSMGNRALTSALREMHAEMHGQCPKFHQIVLTAPDIDADVFRRDLAPAITQTAGRVTLYASSNDEALTLSKQFHGYPRAGDSGDLVVVVPSVDTIDVSSIDTSLVGHSYYGDNSTVLADLFELMQASKSPDQRRWLKATMLGKLKYWQFVPQRAPAPKDGPEAEL